jgi:hypothetical protein
MTYECRDTHAASGFGTFSSCVVLLVEDWLKASSLCDVRRRWELHDELSLRVDWLCAPYLSASQVHLSVDLVRDPSAVQAD